MNFEHIEQAYHLLLDNVQSLQTHLQTNSYDALIEQNIAYLKGTSDLEQVRANHQALAALELTTEEWRRVYQFLFIKLNQTEPLQYNHQFTPDSIGLLFDFLINTLCPKAELDLIEMGSGTGNLAQTLLNHSPKQLNYLGIELDDLLIDLSASISDVLGSTACFVQGDAVRPQLLKPADVILSDLPVGYYPDDQIASRFKVAATEGHTYAHHLFMEQSLKYLKADAYAIFLAPNNLLTSFQSDQLKAWLKEEASLVAVINLPESLFGKKELGKSIIIFQKKTENPEEAFVYPLMSLQDNEELLAFSQAFKKWSQDHAK